MFFPPERIVWHFHVATRASAAARIHGGNHDPGAEAAPAPRSSRLILTFIAAGLSQPQTLLDLVPAHPTSAVLPARFCLQPAAVSKMAIAKALPKLKVEVFVENAPLEEHVDDDDQTSDNEVTKFIEASSGDNFEVKYRFSPGFSIRHAMLVELEIDGEYADSAVFNPGSSVRWNSTYVFKGSREFEDGGYFVRKFCFSQLEIDGYVFNCLLSHRVADFCFR